MKQHFCAVIATLLIAACIVTTPAAAKKKAIKNTAFTYVTQSEGGTGFVFFPIPHGKPGAYQLSYTAAFVSQGSPDAPVTFLCDLILVHSGEQKLLSQSTAIGVSTIAAAPGVNGSATVTIGPDDEIEAVCGRTSGTWTWLSELPLHVTVLRLDSAEEVKIH